MRGGLEVVQTNLEGDYKIVSKKQFSNVNPRIGILLIQGGASVRLFNVLNPKFGWKRLNWLRKVWPEERLRRELRGFGHATCEEWNRLLENRPGVGVEVPS